MPARRAGALAGAALMILVGCGDGGGDGPQTAVRESAGVEETTTTSTTVAASTTSSTTGRTSTTAARRTTTTARATTTTTAPGAPAAPRVLTPATPGTYRFDTVGGTTFAGATTPFPAVTSLTVDPPSGTRQRVARNLRDAAGNGLATEFTLDYRPQGVYLEAVRLTVGIGGVTESRDLRPAGPVLLLATGVRPGAHVEAELGGVTPAKLVVDFLREERVTVAGRAVDTLVMRAVVTLGPGDVTGRQELTVNVDRTSGLWVRERSLTDASAAAGLFTLHSEYTATIQRLTP